VAFGRVSEMPVEAADESSFPFSRPLFFLFLLAAIYTFGLSTFAVHGAIPAPNQSRVLWTLLYGLILTWWVYADKGARRFKVPFEFEYFVLFAWPVVVPYYLYRRLGVRGLVIGVGIWALYLVPYVVSAVVYAVEQVFFSH
jgi:hypothetical protein